MPVLFAIQLYDLCQILNNNITHVIIRGTSDVTNENLVNFLNYIASCVTVKYNRNHWPTCIKGLLKNLIREPDNWTTQFHYQIE